MSLLTILLVLCLGAIFFGGWGQGTFGYWGWSPLGALLAAILVLYLLGALHG